ncbi:DNA-binding response regulator [Aquimarina sp. AD10]|uniref:LytTR family transcriptional regulator n=1 Tax=Aquimarina aggregata TaxID=1642818 RepID=A0A162CUV9_9FLAO|nr:MULTISPECIES: LytTR family DNA-binding domain-containing protein [Aquimarina]AXT61794.1 DNA-binding response regulator [Aquimarina sp. AD10]KZS41409.1 LytTR family transcriptional regulator [Aquimarina aggregata]RKN02592.1 DNA-binding response regulator [Aquimarina sp. AD10]
MNILVIEDESRIAKRILRMTREFFLNTLNEITHIESLQEGITYIQHHKVDLVLLDLNLNGDNGFDLLKNTVSESFHTIIISAYKEQALKAFEHGVLDFVPKPFNKERLDLAFNRVLNKEDIHTKNIKFLAVKKRGEIQLVTIENIIYIKGAGMYSELVLTNGKSFLHDKSLEKLEQLLPDTFIRSHKSYILKIEEINAIKISSGSKYFAELKNEELLPIGRTRYKYLKERMFK